MGTNNYTVFSHDFVKTTQDFFGAYIRGEGVHEDASVQNGKYIHVVDKVRVVDLKELDMVRARCELMFEMDLEAFDSQPFCFGIDTTDLMEASETIAAAGDDKSAAESDDKGSTCDGDKCDL